MTAETLMTKYSGDIEDFVNERMEKMKMDRREAQEKIRKQMVPLDLVIPLNLQEKPA